MQVNLSESIALDIRDKVLNRTYGPGAKIPNEYELAEAYGVCRYTIREAIKKLVATGLVRVERGKGTYVNEMEFSSYFEPIIERLVLIDRNLNEIFDARLAIEMKTAALAAQNATAAEAAAMRKLIGQMYEALDQSDIALHNKLDLTLHEHIALASKNRLLTEILRILYDMIAYTFEYVPANQDKYLRSMAGHERIVAAIEARHADEASREMFEHLNFCKQLAAK